VCPAPPLEERENPSTGLVDEEAIGAGHVIMGVGEYKTFSRYNNPHFIVRSSLLPIMGCPPGERKALHRQKKEG